MQSDVILNKAATIERCLRRIEEEYGNDSDNLKNYTRQDSIILNIQRACEAAIDIAMHIISEKNLGIPQSSREVFDILCNNNLIDENMANKLKAMVGFRNIAVHDYQAINIAIVQQIIKKDLADLKKFTKVIVRSLS